jgi:hypothetical protein
LTSECKAPVLLSLTDSTCPTAHSEKKSIAGHLRSDRVTWIGRAQFAEEQLIGLCSKHTALEKELQTKEMAGKHDRVWISSS